MVRVVIADDHEVIRDGIKFVIEQDPDIQVVGLADNGQGAVELCKEYFPDVVLMDLVMPICDGVEGTRLIKLNFSSIKVIILTTFSDPDKLAKALEFGAEAYILKAVKPDKLRDIIKSVAKGAKYVDPDAFKHMSQPKNGVDDLQGSNESDDVHLTDREKSVAQLIVSGKTNREIAEALCITEGRVKNVITKILEKYQLKDRTALAIYLVKNNLI